MQLNLFPVGALDNTQQQQKSHTQTWAEVQLAILIIGSAGPSMQ
jgi:hypothetical protein